MKPFYLFIFSQLVAPSAWGAACCGGGVSLPAMVSGDERAQVSVSLSQSTIHVDAEADGRWRRREEPEVQRTWRIEGAHIFRDRWQGGISIPVVERQRSDRESSGLGDVAMTGGYEFLPDWDYNPWRPKGVGFLQITLPTGRSIYESEDSWQLDARGRGFWALGSGAVFSKTRGLVDLQFSLELHRSFSRKARENSEPVNLQPGWGGSLTAGAGVHWRAWRLGGSLSSRYEDPISVSGAVESQGSAERVVTGVTSLTYTPVDVWSGSLSYSDQTLFGRPTNTSLAQAVILHVQRRFDR